MPDLIPAWRLRAAGTEFFLLGNLLPDFFDLRTNDTFPEFLSSFLLCDAEKSIFDTCPARLLLKPMLDLMFSQFSLT